MQLEKKIIAPQKRVYFDTFSSYDAGDYVTIQQSNKIGAMHHILTKKL